MFEFDTSAKFDISWLFLTRKFLLSVFLGSGEVCDDIHEPLICSVPYVCKTLPVSLIWDPPSICSSGRGRRGGTSEDFVQCSDSISFNIAGTPAHLKLPVLNCTASICISFLPYESLAKPIFDSRNVSKIHSSLAVLHLSPGQTPLPKWDLILTQNRLRLFIKILFFKCTVANLDFLIPLRRKITYF